MTLITISQRLLQGIACTIVLEASALAQVPGQVPGLPAQVPGLPAQVSGLPGLPAPGIPFPTAIPRPPMEQFPIAAAMEPVITSAARPDHRLVFAVKDGLHFSFATPTAPRENEQARVQGSLAALAAYISERDAQRAATAPADRTAPRDRNPR
jgi:hypothetical protein